MEMRLVMESSASNENCIFRAGPNSDSGNHSHSHVSINTDNKKKLSRPKMLSIASAADTLGFYLRFTFLLRSWSRLLGYYAVTWALVVVLGGFVSVYGKREFQLASNLLLLQVLYLAVNTTWPIIFTRLSDVALHLAGHNLPPGSLPCSVQFRFLRRVGGLAFFVLTFSGSLSFMVVSTIASWRRLPHRNLLTYATYDAALKVFYVLVFMNACVAYVQLWFSMPAFTTFAAGRSICALSYFFRAISSYQGQDLYTRSSKVELIDCVYDMMSDECRELIKTGPLYSLCVDMVPYVYHHPRGFEATLAAMESPDYSVQEAAILMVGFLVHLESHMPSRRLRLQGAIVRKLIDLGLGTACTVEGPRKKAALWSLLMLARHDAKAFTRALPFLQVLVEAVSTTLMDGRDAHSEINKQDPDQGLLPVLNILNAVLQDQDSAPLHSQQTALLSEHAIERLRQIATAQSSFVSDESRQPTFQQIKRAAALTLTLLESPSVQPSRQIEAGLQGDHVEFELADPNSGGIKTKPWIVMLLFMSTVGLSLLFTYAMMKGFRLYLRHEEGST